MLDFSFQKALVLSSKPLGDRKFIVSLFTKEKGRYLGVVKRKNPPMTASFLTGRWQARLNEQMGTFYIEDETSANLAFIDDMKRLNVLTSICFLIDSLLPEREELSFFYNQTIEYLDGLGDTDFQKKYVFWEANLLSAIGFGLDLTKCAGGGDSSDLAYVSPKTGRAVSKKLGLPYHDKLLPLPKFMWLTDAEYDKKSLLEGLNLTGYFLLTHAGLKQLPILRTSLV